MLRANLPLISIAFFAWFTLTSAKVRYFSLNEVGEDGSKGFDSATEGVNQTSGFHAAILVAGSTGYGNYRHQSDMCHAYQMLKKKGISRDDIIVFIYDDIACHEDNPYPGKIYNVPGGYDVYPGCNKDYTGSNVNKEVLMAVLRGDAVAVRGKGSGRVLKKNPKQRVFFAYSGHGGFGYVRFPHGPPLYANEFNRLLVELRKNSVFYEMMIYIEACYSGSMFLNLQIGDEERMFAVSASTPFERSYETFCPSPYKNYTETINPNTIGSCMGDLFTVAWILDAETRNVFSTTVYEHIRRVTYMTSVDWTYDKGSHVNAFGDNEHYIFNEKLGNFFSGGSDPTTNTFDSIEGESNVGTEGEKYKQTDGDLVYLYLRAAKSKNTKASLQLEKELAMRHHTDEVIYGSLNSLIGSGDLPKSTPVSKFAEEAIPRGQGEPVVNDWDCLRGMVDAWEDKCGRLNSYSGLYSRTFANLCNALVTPTAFKESINCKKSVFKEWTAQ